MTNYLQYIKIMNSHLNEFMRKIEMSGNIHETADLFSFSKSFALDFAFGEKNRKFALWKVNLKLICRHRLRLQTQFAKRPTHAHR